MEHIINCPDCGTNLEFRMLEVTEGVLEEMNVCLECGYGYPAGHWFGKEDNLLTRISSEIELRMLQERNEMLECCVDRDWGRDGEFESPIDYFEMIEPITDDEYTCWEQGFLEGMKKAMEIVASYIEIILTFILGTI